MLKELSGRVLKGAALVPPKYYLGALAALILLLLAGIGRTLLTPVPIPKPPAMTQSAPAPMVQPRQSAGVTPAIAGGNLFRKQRKDFTPPSSLAESGDEPVPDIKLLGLIITDTKRLAIVDAELKKYFKREVRADLVLSGVKQVPLADDGRFYEVVPMKGDKLASQTFNEGDLIADYRLERINDDSIEVASVASGKRTLVYLMDSAEAANSLEARAKHVKPVMLENNDRRNIRGSGAVTP